MLQLLVASPVKCSADEGKWGPDASKSILGMIENLHLCFGHRCTYLALLWQFPVDGSQALMC